MRVAEGAGDAAEFESEAGGDLLLRESFGEQGENSALALGGVCAGVGRRGGGRDGTPGLKPGQFFAPDAAPSTGSGQALKGPLFHGAAGVARLAHTSCSIASSVLLPSLRDLLRELPILSSAEALG